MLRRALLLSILPISAWGAGPTATETARAVRDAGLDPEQCYRVRDLSLFKEDIRLYFNDGYLIFAKPVAGERIAAVFTADVEGGDGEILLLPPVRAERQSLARYTGSPNLDEHFRAAVLMFTDSSGRDLLESIEKQGSARKAPEMAPLLSEQWAPVVSNILDSFAPRIAGDLLSPGRPDGLLFAAIGGKTLGNFDVVYDPAATEQILAGQLMERNQRFAYDIWTSFAARRFRTAATPAGTSGFSLTKFRIEATLDDSLRLRATTRATMQIGSRPLRAFAFEISRAEEVTAARIDGVPVELLTRESARSRALRADENEVFLVTSPELLAAGSTHQIEFEHEGDIITSPGNGVYAVRARSNWYPHSGAAFANYELAFNYPKRLTLVTTGDIVSDRVEGDARITERRTLTPIRLAGFNLGTYEKSSITAAGLTVDVFGNRGLDPALQPPPRTTTVTQTVQPPRGPRREEITTIVQNVPPPDPLARLNAVAIDVAACFQYYSGLFGPPPLKTLTVSPIPGTFGQGFPGLVYLSTLSYLDPLERPAGVRNATLQTFFSDLMVAHEVAHQWWGNVVTGKSYQDEWLMEALAHYSALMWIEKKKGSKALEEVMADFQRELLHIGEDGQSLESAGPVTWGYRLEAAKSAEAFRVITYEKGAWVLHMLRKRIGNERFLKVLAELRKQYEFRGVSSADLLDLVKKSLPPGVSADSIESFFDNWVYSTGIPTLRVKYSVKASAKENAPSWRVSGTLEQSAVNENFSVDVPVEIQFAKGPMQTIWVRTSNEPSGFSATLKQAPVKVSVPAGSSVLAVRK